MEVESAFQTPASRRSPVQIGNKQQRQRSKDDGIVTKAFENLRPFATEATINHGSWLQDDVCEKSFQDLGIVMPPIGYEADMRTFRRYDSVEIENDKEDIYEDISHVDQGTDALLCDSDNEDDLDMIGQRKENNYEFGFGYRNGYAFNKAHIHTQSSLTYITHKHHSIENFNKQFKGKSSRKSFSQRSRQQQRRKQAPMTQSAHKMDVIEDITTVKTRTRSRGAKGKNNSGNRTFSQNGTQSVRTRTRLQRPSFGLNTDSDEEDRKNGYEDNNNNNNFSQTQDDPQAWLQNLSFDNNQQPSSAERRRQSNASFASEYSNYAPEGQRFGRNNRARRTTFT